MRRALFIGLGAVILAGCSGETPQSAIGPGVVGTVGPTIVATTLPPANSPLVDWILEYGDEVVSQLEFLSAMGEILSSEPSSEEDLTTACALAGDEVDEYVYSDAAQADNVPADYIEGLRLTRAGLDHCADGNFTAAVTAINDGSRLFRDFNDDLAAAEISS